MALVFAAPRHLATHWPHVSQTPPMVPDAFCRGFSLQTSRRFALCIPSDAFSLFRHFDHSLPSGSPLRSVQSLLRCVPRTSTTVCARPAAVPALMCSFSLASSHRSLRGLHFGILRLSHMLPSGARRRDARCFRVEVSGLAASDMAPAWVMVTMGTRPVALRPRSAVAPCFLTRTNTSAGSSRFCPQDIYT